jgi:hypothetical protein
MQHQPPKEDPKVSDCLRVLSETHAAALRTAAWATVEGVEAATPHIVRLLFDCAEITDVAANFLLRRP